MKHRRARISRNTPETRRREARPLTIIEQRLGQALLGAAEAAKIAVAGAGSTGNVDIPLDAVEGGLAGHPTEPDALAALKADMARIVAAGVEPARRAGVAPEQVDVVNLTGGFTGPLPLAIRIAAPFVHARTMRGAPLTRVAQGLGWHARRVFG